MKDVAAFLVRLVKVPYEDFHTVERRKTPFDDDGELFGIPHEDHVESHSPRMKECRFAALQIRGDGEHYVVYDRLLSRIVDGVYHGAQAKNDALGVAELYNDGYGHPDMSPNGDALGLIYPKGKHHDT